MNCIPSNGDKLYKKEFWYLEGRGNYQALSPFWDYNFLILFHINLLY